MSRNQITFVVELPVSIQSQDDVRAELLKLTTLVNQSAPHLRISGGSTQDVLSWNHALTAYIKQMLTTASPEADAEVYVDTKGTHYWQYPGGYFADSVDLLLAQNVYHSFQALELDQGPVSLAPSSP